MAEKLLWIINTLVRASQNRTGSALVAFFAWIATNKSVVSSLWCDVDGDAAVVVAALDTSGGAKRTPFPQPPSPPTSCCIPPFVLTQFRPALKSVHILGRSGSTRKGTAARKCIVAPFPRGDSFFDLRDGHLSFFLETID